MISLLASLLSLSIPHAQAQDLMNFRAYEAGTLHLMVNEDVDPEHPLGRVLHVTVSEGEGPSRIHCERVIALDAPRVPRQATFESCSGIRIRLERPDELRSEKFVRGAVLNASGAPESSIQFELKYTQAGVHEGSRDD